MSFLSTVLNELQLSSSSSSIPFVLLIRSIVNKFPRRFRFPIAERQANFLAKTKASFEDI